jgi:hypothetical protein
MEHHHAKVHARLILYRPIQSGCQKSKSMLELAVILGTSVFGVKPNNVYITYRPCLRKAVKMIPHGVSHEASSHPAIGQSERTNRLQRTPSQSIAR